MKAELPSRQVEAHEADVFRKLAFTYYYDWTTDEPEYVMFTEDPGPIGSRHTSDLLEFAELSEDEPLEQVRLYRGFAKRWLAQDNYDFAETFFQTCADKRLFELPGSVRSYIQDGSVFDDFYLSDANKYRASTSSTATRTALSAAFTTRELEAINPSLIFAFGNDAWDFLGDELAVTPLEGVYDPSSGITQVDGHLFESQRLIDTYVLPLLHMSGQAYGPQRGSKEYGRCLSSGLNTWATVN